MVFGVSLAGGRKYYLSKPVVRYRVHGRNCHFGQKFDHSYKYRRKVAINRLIGVLASKIGYDLEQLSDVIYSEFRSQPHRTFRSLKQYLSIAMRNGMSAPRRLRLAMRLFADFVVRPLTTRPEPTAAAAPLPLRVEEGKPRLHAPLADRAPRQATGA